MGESETISSTKWSTLNTIKTIDVDCGIIGNDIIPANSEFLKSSVKSIFIESLVDQLCKLLEKDPQRRRKIYDGICAKLFEMKLVDKTYQLEELASLRGHYQQAIISLLRTPDQNVFKIPSFNLEWSRYTNEYEEVCFIAAGGFGRVYKAKHRLDQVFYAIKKISFKFQNMTVLIMESNEVKTLAKLNHPNIVQYKAAWLEPFFSNTPALTGVDIEQKSSSDSDGVVFESSNSFSTNYDVSSSLSREKENNLVICKYQTNDWSFSQCKGLQVNAILYVSMQLCDETLREWLNKRNSSNKSIDLPLCINIMIQATKGIEYIHSYNIVHHDIKPSNIFLSDNSKSIQVGDFGLSCCLQGHTHSACPLEGGRFGTPLYAAPEQHKGQCNPKSDMFSLGIVFIELLSVFATEMERVSVLTKSRSGYIPPNIPEELVPIIKLLISPNAEERPSSNQLLKILNKFGAKPNGMKSLSITKTQLISFNEKSVVNSINQTEKYALPSNCDITEMLKVKDQEITELKLMLAKRDNEIAQLKQLIAGIECYN